MKKRRLEQDRNGEYGTQYVGYDIIAESEENSLAKQNPTARAVILRIQEQAAVNRLFNMPSEVLLRKVKEAVMKNGEPAGEERLPSITHLLGVELLEDGNVALGE